MTPGVGRLSATLDLVEQMRVLFQRHGASEKTEALEREGLALLWPVLEPRLEGRGPALPAPKPRPFGFFNYDAEDGLESTRYRPENEEEWRYYSGKEPGYYGRPTGNIAEFAEELSADSRFMAQSPCAQTTCPRGAIARSAIVGRAFVRIWPPWRFSLL